MSADAVLHLAALHALSQAGFASTSRAASLTLSSVLSRYLAVVARACADRAALAGRAKVAAVDVVEALDELGVGGVAELGEWCAGRDEDVFVGAKMDELALYLQDGLSMDEGFRLDYVARDEDEMDVDSDGDGDDTDGDDAVVPVLPDSRPARPRSPSPPLAWLPLPSGPSRARGVVAADVAPDVDAPATLVDRYRQPTPYASSQLAQERAFDPPRAAPPAALPPAPSSFSALLAAYKASAGEISIAPRQNDVRRQAADIARGLVAHPEAFSPPDTLATPLAPPRATPIVPSHADAPAHHPPRMLPADPRRAGLLAQLVLAVRSPHLPPVLRDRLTALRPPAPHRAAPASSLGEPVRGPSDAALARARGKPADGEQEVYLRATWDSGPRGIERARAKLPTGRKVVAAAEGEVKPRGLEDKRAEPLKIKFGRRESGVGTPGTPAAEGAGMAASAGTAGVDSGGSAQGTPAVKQEPELIEER